MYTECKLNLVLRILSTGYILTIFLVMAKSKKFPYKTFILKHIECKISVKFIIGANKSLTLLYGTFKLLVSLCLGVPKETWANEKRIALTPAATAMLVKKAIRRAALFKFLLFCEGFQPLGSKIVKKNKIKMPTYFNSVDFF